MPALRALHPAAERNVLALAESLRDEGAVLDALVDDMLGEPVTLERSDNGLFRELRVYRG